MSVWGDTHRIIIILLYSHSASYEHHKLFHPKSNHYTTVTPRCVLLHEDHCLHGNFISVAINSFSFVFVSVCVSVACVHTPIGSRERVFVCVLWMRRRVCVWRTCMRAACVHVARFGLNAGWVIPRQQLFQRVLRLLRIVAVIVCSVRFLRRSQAASSDWRRGNTRPLNSLRFGEHTT